MRVVVALLALLTAAPAAAQDTSAIQTLTMTMPRAALASTHRVKKAYTGMTWRIPIVVIGGCAPYVFSLTNAASGMTVAGWSTTVSGAPAATGTTTGQWGVVTWVNPSSNATVTYTATDNCGTAVSETVTTTVGTSGFKFVDAVAGSDGNAGTQAAPWQTLNAAYNGVSAGDIVYLYPRATVNSSGVLSGSTYDYTSIPTSGTCVFPTTPEGRIDVNEASRWSGFIRDPRGATGDEAVINHNFSGTWSACPITPYQRIVGDSLWFEGLTIYKVHTKGFEFRASGSFGGWVFWDNKCDTYGPGFNGSNSACLMTASTGGTHKYGSAFIGNRGYRGAGSGDNHTDFLKTYNEDAFAVIGNTTTGQTTAGQDGEFSIKGTHGWVEVRDNRCYSMGSGQACLGGNTAGIGPYTIRYNNFIVNGTDSNSTAALAMHMGQGPGTVSGVTIQRNTVVGRLRFWAAGPWSGSVALTRNVILNGDNAQATPYLCDGGPGSASQWSDCSGTPVPTFSLTSNYTSTDTSAVNAEGFLTGGVRTSDGPDSTTPKGHELTGGGGVPPPPPPATAGSRRAAPRIRVL